MGLLWLMAKQVEGDLLKCGVEILLEHPYIKLKLDKDMAEPKAVIDKFTAYFKGIYDLGAKVKDAGEKIKDLAEQVEKNAEDYLKQVEDKLKDDLFSLPKYLKRIKINFERIKAAGVLIVDLAKDVEDTLKDLSNLPAILKDLKQLEKINQVASNAHKNKWDTTIDICFNTYDKEVQYGKTPEEGKKFWETRKDNKVKMKADSAQDRTENVCKDGSKPVKPTPGTGKKPAPKEGTKKDNGDDAKAPDDQKADPDQQKTPDQNKQNKSVNKSQNANQSQNNQNQSQNQSQNQNQNADQSQNQAPNQDDQADASQL